jgi:isoleucyl-tRNA synthetase
LAQLEADKKVVLNLPGGTVELDQADLQIRLQAKEGWAASQGPTCVVVLATELSAELVAEGLARELVHAIQTQRKDQGYEYTDRIELGCETDDLALRAAIEKFSDYIRGEVLAVRLSLGSHSGGQPIELKVGGAALRLWINVVRS